MIPLSQRSSGKGLSNGMNVLIISCSKKAYELGERLKAAWELQLEADSLRNEKGGNGNDLHLRDGNDARRDSDMPLPDENGARQDSELVIIHKTKTKMLPEISMTERIEDCVAENFPKIDVLIFICATGIAVRSIAPLIRHKSVDPAVLVMDETGRYCISLLSGHAGGANFYTHQVSALVGAEPVITTATDREGKFAVDVFARENALLITDWKKAKDVSVCVLAGEPVVIVSDYPIKGTRPKELKAGDDSELPENGKNCLRVWVTNKKTCQDEGRVLRLIVPNVVVGIGCRKNTDFELIESAVLSFLSEHNIDIRAVKKIASIDLKANEMGLLKLSEKYKLPFETFSAEELSSVEGSFTESEFVEKTTGVSNVCERAAAFGGRQLKIRKTRYPQVTLALSEERVDLKF